MDIQAADPDRIRSLPATRACQAAYPKQRAAVDGPAAQGFRAEFAGDDRSRDRIAALLAAHRAEGDRSCRRFPTHLRARVGALGRAADAYVTNLSRSGAFVKTEPLPPESIVDLDLAIPGAPGRETAQGWVVHAKDSVGIGVQFIGGSDEFRARVDAFVAQLAA